MPDRQFELKKNVSCCNYGTMVLRHGVQDRLAFVAAKRCRNEAWKPTRLGVDTQVIRCGARAPMFGSNQAAKPLEKRFQKGDRDGF